MPPPLPPPPLHRPHRPSVGAGGRPARLRSHRPPRLTILIILPPRPQVLEGAELRRASGRREGGGRGPAPKVPPLEHVLRVSKQLVHARAYQAKLVATVCELLLQAFGPLASAVAFPELALPVVAQVRNDDDDDDDDSQS
jgi:hypothetical protein